MIKLLTIMRPTGALLPTVLPWARTVVMFSQKWPPGTRDMGTASTSWAVRVDAINVTYSGKGDRGNGQPQDGMAKQVQQGAVFQPYCTFRSI